MKNVLVVKMNNRFPSSILVLICIASVIGSHSTSSSAEGLRQAGESLYPSDITLRLPPFPGLAAEKGFEGEFDFSLTMKETRVIDVAIKEQRIKEGTEDSLAEIVAFSTARIMRQWVSLTVLPWNPHEITIKFSLDPSLEEDVVIYRIEHVRGTNLPTKIHVISAADRFSFAED
ncbi:MAG TPA: hypothetical protein VLV83_10470 [Acidobacteriota bacterium]|nr:hypothetical protein [Acidobacteriota bacterium]